MPYIEPTDVHEIQDHRVAWKDNNGNMRPGYLEGGLKEFPKLMYPKMGGFPKQVSDPKEQAEAEKAGFTETPKAECMASDGLYSPPKETSSAPAAPAVTPGPVYPKPLDPVANQPPKKG